MRSMICEKPYDVQQQLMLSYELRIDGRGSPEAASALYERAMRAGLWIM